jgi:hypothetical protein
MKRWIVALLLIILYAWMTAPSVTAQNNKDCGEMYRTYLPLVGRDMIIARFGTSWGSGYQLGTLKGADDYQIARPASVGQVGGMSGTFDFWGSTANPLTAQVVNKKFEIAKPYIYTAGTGLIIKSAPNGLAGDGTSFVSEVAAGDCIRWTNAGLTYTVKVLTVESNTLVTISTEEYSNVITSSSENSFTIGKLSMTYAAIETELTYLQQKTIGAGESKLWAALRDGTTHRWAWAKCNRLRAPEDYNTKFHLPVELEFLCREGLWYGETQGTSGTLTQATSSPYVLTNNGTLPATCVLTITPGGGAFASVTVTNTTNGDTYTYTGAVASGKALVVNSGAWSITNDGAAAYAGMVYGATQSNWLRLNPGANSFTISKTGTATSWAATLTWYDTY